MGRRPPVDCQRIRRPAVQKQCAIAALAPPCATGRAQLACLAGMARILLVSPEGQQVVELRDHNSLGRHPSNTVQLLDKIVSKEHCIIERRPNGFTLRDLGSLNGTYVNGERVAGERDLRHGDDIALGQTRARYDDGSGRPMPAPSGGYPQQGAPFQGQHPPQSGWQQAGPPSMGAPSTVGAPGAYASAPQPLTPLGSPQQLSATPAAGFQRVPLQGPPPGVPAALPTANVDINDKARQIGTQIAATQKGFLPYDNVSGNTQ